VGLILCHQLTPPREQASDPSESFFVPIPNHDRFRYGVAALERSNSQCLTVCDSPISTGQQEVSNNYQQHQPGAAARRHRGQPEEQLCQQQRGEQQRTLPRFVCFDQK
jgi:hypothetical protein